MPTDDLEALTAVLKRALSESLGLRLQAEDADALRRRLYIAVRKNRERGVKDFSQLTIRSLDAKTLLILKEVTNG